MTNILEERKMQILARNKTKDVWKKMMKISYSTFLSTYQTENYTVNKVKN